MIPLSIPAILVAALANFIIGFLMHGPIGGKLWIKLANIKPTGKEKLSDMIPQMVSNFIVNVVFACGLAVVIAIVASSPYGWSSGVVTGILCAVGVWFAFTVTVTAIDVIWSGKSYKLWLFECFSSLLCLVAMGAILGAW
jgi:hypothetical protein